MWATTYTCTFGGATNTDWNTNSNWTSCNSGHPIAPTVPGDCVGGDCYMVVIPTGKTVECDNATYSTGATCAFGDYASAAGNLLGELTLQGTAQINVNSGSTLLAYNKVMLQRGSTFAAYGTGQLVFIPPAGVVYSLGMNVTGSNDPIHRICNDSTCTDSNPTTSWAIQVWTCNSVTNGKTINGYACSNNTSGIGFISSDTSNRPWKATYWHTIFYNLGSASNNSITRNVNTIVVASPALKLDFALIASGNFNNATTTGVEQIQVDGMRFFDCLNANCGIFTNGNSTTLLASGSYINNIYIGTSPARVGTLPSFSLYLPGVKIGSAKLMGDATDTVGANVWNGFLNVSTTGTSVGTLGSSVYNYLNVSTIATSGSRSALIFTGQNSNTVAVSGALIKVSDAFGSYLANGNQGTGSANLYTYILCDGGGSPNLNNSGDCQWDSYANTYSYYLNINGAGTWDWAVNQNTARQTNFAGTTYQSYEGQGPHTATSPTQTSLTSIKGNLYLSSWDNGFVSSTADNSGIGIGDNTHSIDQVCAGSCIDYNGYFANQGTGDPGALNHAGYYTQTNAALGTGNGTGGSYMGMSGLRPYVSKAAGQGVTFAANSGNTNVTNCTGCFGASQNSDPGPYIGTVGSAVVNTGRKDYGIILSVTSSSAATIQGLHPSWNNATDALTISPGGIQGQVYGVTAGFGTHDIHADPALFDPHRTMCTWNMDNGGTGVGNQTRSYCYPDFSSGQPVIVNGGWLATFNVGSLTVTCPTCAFVTWGITSSDYMTGIDNATYAFTGFSKVASVTDNTHLVLVSTIGANVGMVIFASAETSLGINMMKQGGFAPTITCTSGGCTTTWAATTATTGFKASDLWAYMLQGFKVNNGMFCNAYNDGTKTYNIGGLNCLPAAIISQ